MDPVDYASDKIPPQSDDSSTFRLQIFLAAVQKLGASITHVNAYGSSVHRAMRLVDIPDQPLRATSTILNASICKLPHPSRVVNFADIGV